MKFCNTNLKHYTFPLATAFCVALSGCGGGDDSTAATSGSTDTLTAVVITEANMADVAGAAIMASSANNYGTSGAGLVMGVETTSMPAPTDTLLKLTVDQAKAANSRLGAQDIVVGVQSTETIACGVSGSMTYTFDLQSTSSTFAAGDRIGVSFNACQESDGTLMNGGMQITIHSFSGFTDPYNPVGSMNFSASYSNFSISTPQGGFTTNGAMTIGATITATGASMTIQASSVSFVVESNGERMSLTLSSLNQQVSEDSDKFQMTVSEHFAADFPRFAGSGDVTTLAPLIEYWTTGIASGKFKVTGNASALYVTFLGGDAVYLELDRDNDGTIDATANKTLYELDPTIGVI